MGEQQLWDHFGTWGEVVQVRVIPAKAIGFVRYTYRAAAEFAKVAMANQRMGLAMCIQVKWALDDPNPRAIKQRRIEAQDMVNAAVDDKIALLGLSEIDLTSFALANQPKDISQPTVPYPNTDAQYPVRKELHEKIKQVHGPVTKAEVEAEENHTKAVANIDRMNIVLARIDAMYNSGEIEAPQRPKD